jgi:hypothetical protein
MRIKYMFIVQRCFIVERYAIVQRYGLMPVAAGRDFVVPDGIAGCGGTDGKE